MNLGAFSIAKWTVIVMPRRPKATCLHCQGPSPHKKRYCDACRALCHKCWQHPRENHPSWCAHCRNIYNTKHRRRRDPRTVYLQLLRHKINRWIREGKMEREPCVVCGDPKSQVYMPRTLVESRVFVCRSHYDIISKRYAKRSRARARVKRQRLARLGRRNQLDG